MATRKLRYCIAGVIIVPAITLAILTSGCLWGTVRDADTDVGIAGVTVKYTDANGHTGTAITDANGIYKFDQASVPIPAAGPVTFEISRPGYEPLTAARLVQYNDNPNATLSNLSTFWEAQGFSLTPHLIQTIEVQLTSVDVDKALLAPPNPILTAYVATLRVYDPNHPSTVLCEDATNLTPISSTDPPPQALNFDCHIEGNAFRAVVTVVMQRQWIVFTPGPVPMFDVDVSTAAFDWIAPELVTNWQNQTIHSTDVSGPDDPDLEFDAQLRYKSQATAPVPLVISDGNLKDNFAAVDGTTVLARLAGIPILTWNYKTDSSEVRHLGPMAQDFYAAFGLGDTDKAIYSVDAQGVAFAAIQALYKIAQEQDAEINVLQGQVDDLDARVAALEARLGQ